MNLSYIVSVLIGIGTLFVALSRARVRLREVEEMVAKAQARRQAQVERIKRSARGTLKLARDLREARRRKANLRDVCARFEAELSASRLLDKRIYVADERKSEAERCFLARITNPDYAMKVNPKLLHTALDSWRHGRRIIIWAPDEKKARERLEAHYPGHKGFHIVSLTPRDLDL